MLGQTMNIYVVFQQYKWAPNVLTEKIYQNSSESLFLTTRKIWTLIQAWEKPKTSFKPFSRIQYRLFVVHIID